MMKNKKVIIIFIVCVVLFLVLVPFAIKLSISIHRYIVPEGSVEPRYVARAYMDNNQELIEQFGENYRYYPKDMSWSTNENGVQTSTVIFWIPRHGTYEVYLEYQDGEWVVVD